MIEQRRPGPAPTQPVTEPRPVARTTPLQKALRLHTGQRRLVLTVVLPTLLFYAAFRYYPVLQTLVLSLTDARLLRRDYTFVGLDNFARLFGDPVFRKIIWNTTYYAIATTMITTALALCLAFLFEPIRRGGGLLRLIYFLPMATSTIAIATMWKWLYQPRFGLLNQVLGMFGVTPVPWLNSPAWAMPSLILMSVWGGVGYSMLIMYAGLKHIPHEYVEAARIDGASTLQITRLIKLPLMIRVITFSLVTGLIGSFQVFQQVYLMTGGGPLNATNVIALRIYEDAFRHLQIGLAATSAIVLFLIVSLLTLLQFRLQRAGWE
jgi:multiple sugar transport system permease protein